MTVKGSYADGKCPDCGRTIPAKAVEGSECSNCGHVFWLIGDNYDEAEQTRRDEKNGLYGEHVDVAN
jgi:DNA-directed RNA polymerase subunit RPC12/RpoP